MKEYFFLQYKMTNRRFKDAGLEPVLAYVALAGLFIGLSVYLFRKTEWAVYVYLLMAGSLIIKLSEAKRNEFLKICFPNLQRNKIRVTENLLVAAPFIIFLAIQQQFYYLALLIVCAPLMALLHVNNNIFVRFPTPFYKKPFEFSVGFRNSFLLVLGAYMLTVIAVAVNNFNLGIFSLLLMFSVTLSFYAKPENEYYVWIHSMHAKKFLFEKIKIALVYSSWLVLPIALVMGIFFAENLWVLLLFVLIGTGFLVGIIVSKYANFPHEISLLQGILLSLCIIFPPLLLILIPYNFHKSMLRLNRLLK